MMAPQSMAIVNVRVNAGEDDETLDDINTKLALTAADRGQAIYYTIMLNGIKFYVLA